MNIQNYKATTPELDLFAYFTGETTAWGIFQDRSGNVRRAFTVAIKGDVKDNTLTLVEDFQYSDGETEQRIWVITRHKEGHYTGVAKGVVGEAEGQVQGNALNWKYDFDLQVGKKTYRVHFDDWMFLQTGGVLINRAYVSKWGINVGEVTLFFQRP